MKIENVIGIDFIGLIIVLVVCSLLIRGRDTNDETFVGKPFSVSYLENGVLEKRIDAFQTFDEAVAFCSEFDDCGVFRLGTTPISLFGKGLWEPQYAIAKDSIALGYSTQETGVKK